MMTLNAVISLTAAGCIGGKQSNGQALSITRSKVIVMVMVMLKGAFNFGFSETVGICPSHH